MLYNKDKTYNLAINNPDKDFVYVYKELYCNWEESFSLKLGLTFEDISDILSDKYNFDNLKVLEYLNKM